MVREDGNVIRQQERLFQQYDYESKRISEQIHVQKQKMIKFDLFERQVDDLQICTEIRLDHLSQTWKGRQAENYLSESLAMHIKYRQDNLQRIRGEKQELQIEMRQLQHRQEELLRLKRQVINQDRRG